MVPTSLLRSFFRFCGPVKSDGGSLSSVEFRMSCGRGGQEPRDRVRILLIASTPIDGVIPISSSIKDTKKSKGYFGNEKISVRNGVDHRKSIYFGLTCWECSDISDRDLVFLYFSETINIMEEMNEFFLDFHIH